MNSKETFLQTFELDVPLIQGPMGGISDARLSAAVSNAGGLGILPIWMQPPDQAIETIKETQSLTDRSIGVNFRADAVQTELIQASLDAGVRIVHLFWGDPTPSISAVNSNDAIWIVTVGDKAAAQQALDAGASALIAQAVEAGGHVLGDRPSAQLWPEVVDVAKDVPVIAAGGVATPDDARQAMALGVSGVLMGTRFLASQESNAHPAYIDAVLEAGEGATARSECFDGLWPDAPHRTLINSTYAMWNDAGRPPTGRRPGENDTVMNLQTGDAIPRYFATPPDRTMTGDVTATAMYAGTGVARISTCPNAAEIVKEFAAIL